MKVTVTKNSPNINKVGFTTKYDGVILFTSGEEYDVYIGEDGVCLVESHEHAEEYDVDQYLYAGTGDSITITL